MLEIKEEHDAASTLKLKRSPGMDIITEEMFKRIWLAIPEHAQTIFDRCWRRDVSSRNGRKPGFFERHMTMIGLLLGNKSYVHTFN